MIAVSRGSLFDGNHRAFYNYARAQGLAPLILLGPGVPIPEGIDPDFCLPQQSFVGAMALLRSHVILLHHGSREFGWPFLGYRRMVINLWHGVPIKGIFFHEDKTLSWRRQRELKRETKLYNSIICASAIDRLAMSSAMQLPLNRFWVTGLPRNDWLLEAEEALPKLFKDASTLLRERLQGDKLVLYAPTFRQGGQGIYAFTQQEQQALEKMLERHQARLCIRSHINDRTCLNTSSQRILWLDNNIETQVILRETDVLITDFSGIWIDYLLLERPLLAFLYDEEVYLQERPLMYDLRTLFPGPVCGEFSEMMLQLDQLLSQGLNAMQQLKLGQQKALMHAHHDTGASARIFSLIQERLSSD
ncbi:MAG: CDP-glycerol glycerophosphotransferase family protein [Candidatus Sericytochromatia bacterium]